MERSANPDPSRQSQGIFPVEENVGTYYGLYTYQQVDGTFVCNIYTNGSGTTLEQCSAEGVRLQKQAAQNNEPNLGYMVAPVSAFAVAAAEEAS